MTSTKMYWEMLSLQCLKNQWPISGKSSMMNAMQSTTEMPSRYQNMSSAFPVTIPTTTVSSSRASVSVMTADGDRDGLVAGDAQLADDGVGDQGLRGEESGQQDRRVDRETEYVIARQDAEQKRNAEGVESEYEASGAALAEIRHVHVQSREEHDVKQSGRAGEDDTAVAQHEIQSVRPDYRAGDDKPQQIGDLQFVEQQGSGQDDDEDQ